MAAPDAQALFAVQVHRNIAIPMPDGVSLAADLFLPDAPGPFPAVFDYYPYRKDDMMAGYLRQQVYLAERGYAALRIDVRGTGGSGGVALDEYVLQEQLDAVAAIAWMAKQPWCNGNVGMFGISYGGFNSLQVAMHRPPALKAICPIYFTDNRYTDDVHYKGGAMQILVDIGGYGLNMVCLNALPPYPETSGVQWAALWEQHLEADPWLLNWVEHQTWDDYWRHGSLCEDYGAITCAVYLIGGWRDGYTNCNLRTFEHLRAPKRMIIGPWPHALPDIATPGPRVDYLYEMVRFYDHWLKGVDNGVMAEPPITLFVQEYDPPTAERDATSGFWRHEPGWPLERVAEQSLFLADAGALEGAPPADQYAAQYVYSPSVGTSYGLFSGGAPFILPVDQREDDARSLTWTSAPLDAPLEILGFPEARLRVCATAEIATIVARLVDIAPDGTAALITKGVLNLTHRESHSAPSPMIPSQTYDVVVQLDATSWMFAPGHRIRLSVTGADFPNVWPSPLPYTGSVHCGGEGASRLVLPVASPQTPPLPPPHLAPPLPFAPTASSQSDRPAWRVTRDHLEDTTEVLISSGGRTRVGESASFTSQREVLALVSERNPARVSYRGLNRITFHWPDREIETVARGQIQSSADAFHITVQLEITINGVAYHARSWTRSFPRVLL
jgi:hypothetical protein